MARQRNIFLIALVCSLCLHLASLGVYVEYSLKHPAAISAWSASHPQTRPTTAPAEELIVVYPEMGESTGTGIGSNSSPGDRPLTAKEATEDQALLSRDPVGMGRIGALPSQFTGPTGDGNGGTPAVVVVAAPVPVVEPPKVLEPTPAPTKSNPSPAVPPVQEVASLPLPRADMAAIQSDPRPKVVDSPTLVSKPVPEDFKKVEEQRQKEVPPERQAVAVAKPQAATGDGRRPGVPQPSADPVPESDSDSDPFSRISSTAVFRDGRLDVRRGRKVKTTRPQIQIAGQWDMRSLNSPTVVLEVHISPTGKVTDVRIAHSSGSNQIDEPTRLAVYDWWFEPARDKSGKPISDVIFFSIEFVG